MSGRAKSYEVEIQTPRGQATLIVQAGSQRDAVAQARAIAEQQGGRLSGGGYARELS